MTMQDLSIADMGRALRAGGVTAEQLTEAALEQVRQRDHALHCFVLLAAERALEDARQADRDLRNGRDCGPLHGVPYALKDIYDTAGMRTTCHSKLRIDHVPGRQRRGRQAPSGRGDSAR